ncbi:MAG: hypothetical protein PHO62_02005 [Sulfurimonas sp.]|uniref:hypothetical protein n=1 Tax=Sulfurimonas sp. TaxID=2022749 RepID=UPI00261FC0CA|nr:hypothetical protein [Sulfurimonas sp.]MDD5372181.1 hypothetical protein [Sulfurimonas sp.]
MKQILSAIFLVLLFSGCVEKKNVLYIDNQSLCSEPMATLYLKDVDIKNNAKTFNIAPDEIRSALIGSLKETNCFKVFSYNKSRTLESDKEYILNAKVTLTQEEEVVEKNIFKKEQKELITMAVVLQAYNENKKVNATAKSELSTDKSKILGFKNERDVTGDSQTVLQNATRKASLALTDGFIKLQEK